MQQVAQRVFSGIQPSGAQVHIGNYMGAMKRFVTYSGQFETIVCIVDLHALTSVTTAGQLRDYTKSLAAAYLATGLDPGKVIIFRQSDVPDVTELCWYLACQFPLGLLKRAHALKDAQAKETEVNAGLMYYPVLMAADILLYKATKVPVGADQKQHLEMAREAAQKFNGAYGETFPLPEPMIAEETGVIPGLDGRKMSKSYNNYIGLFEDPKEIKTKVMRIVTDSKGLEEPKDPDSCNVFKLYQLFASPVEISALRERYLAGGMGYGHAKVELLNVLMRTLDPLRERYRSWMSRPDDLLDVLADGASRARVIAHSVMAEVRQAIGLDKYL